MTDSDRRQFIRLALAGAGLTAAGTAAADHDTRGRRPAGSDGDGIVTVTAEDSFTVVVERLTARIEGNDNLRLLATVDHQDNAEAVGRDLPPTTLLLFGNPNLGTQLMQASRSAALDLPQKLLVWEDDDGETMISYNDPAWFAARHDIYTEGDVLETIESALSSLTDDL